MARMTAEEMDALNLSDSQWDAAYFVLRLVAAQNAKWGEQNHDDAIWLAIDTEELGEAAQAVDTSRHAPGFDQLGVRVFASAVGRMGEHARELLEHWFGTQPSEKSRKNIESHPPDLDKEIGQTASVAIDWLASRWRREEAEAKK